MMNPQPVPPGDIAGVLSLIALIRDPDGAEANLKALQTSQENHAAMLKELAESRAAAEAATEEQRAAEESAKSVCAEAERKLEIVKDEHRRLNERAMAIKQEQDATALERSQGHVELAEKRKELEEWGEKQNASIIEQTTALGVRAQKLDAREAALSKREERLARDEAALQQRVDNARAAAALLQKA